MCSGTHVTSLFDERAGDANAERNASAVGGVILNPLSLTTRIKELATAKTGITKMVRKRMRTL